MTYRLAAKVDDLWQGEMCGVLVEGLPVLLVAIDDTVCAFEDRCMHQGAPLSAGRLENGEIVCRVHEWRYDARTGRGTNPETARLRSIPLRMEGEDILVDVDTLKRIGA